MIQLFGSVFGHDASTWNFGRSLAKAGATDSAQTNSDETIFISSSRMPAGSTGIASMLCFQSAAIKRGGAEKVNLRRSRARSPPYAVRGGGTDVQSLLSSRR